LELTNTNSCTKKVSKKLVKKYTGYYSNLTKILGELFKLILIDSAGFVMRGCIAQEGGRRNEI